MPVFYVSVSGSNSNPGTITQPWATLAFALTQINAGDTLYLRAGSYFENGLTCSVAGTAGSPVTIASYPGETAIIDGGHSEFAVAGNSQWTLFNAGIGEYKSAGTYAGTFAGAWLADSDIQLLQYGTAADLESTSYLYSQSSAIYQGAGLMLKADGHIYIRLADNPQDLFDAAGNPIPSFITDQNPNDHAMCVFTAGTLITMSGAAWVQFENLTFQGCTTTFSASSSPNITISGCTVRYGSFGIQVNDAGTTGWTITNNTFDNGFPPWTYWADIKNQAQEFEAYPEFQSDAITGSVGLVGFTITNNVIRDAMDGILLKDGTTNTTVTGNYFIRNHDDAIQVYQGAGGSVTITGNMMWSIAGGMGQVFSSGTPAGPVYFYGNVVDDSILQRLGRPGNNESTPLSQWDVFSPWNNHSGTPALNMYVYNNTFVTRQSQSFKFNGSGPTYVASANKKVYNNLIWALDTRTMFRDDRTTSGAAYDGDAFWRLASSSTYHLFNGFANGSNFDTLAALQAANTGWETLALQVDPGFSSAALAVQLPPNTQPSQADLAGLWNRYVPSNRQILTTGYDLSSSGWPGTGPGLLAYRGAEPGGASTGLLLASLPQ